MRTLIIPDIHSQIENADHWLSSQRYDYAVFLGDYFDNHGDNVSDARKTAMWLRDRMDSKRDVFLLGNHDAAYMFPHSDELYCPGFTRAKAKAIREILQPAHWGRFKLAHEEQGWLISHAGFHPVWMKELTVEKILRRCGEAMQLAARGKVDPILGAGEERGGLQRFGGPLWMDWDSLMPIPGIHQIVGHSAGTEVREKSTLESRNFCLDVNNASVAGLLCDGHLEILPSEAPPLNRN
jgi:aromatic ring-cleaving dioxygenase